jgi:hypothetical protein
MMSDQAAGGRKLFKLEARDGQTCRATMKHGQAQSAKIERFKVLRWATEAEKEKSKRAGNSGYEFDNLTSSMTDGEAGCRCRPFQPRL